MLWSSIVLKKCGVTKFEAMKEIAYHPNLSHSFMAMDTKKEDYSKTWESRYFFHRYEELWESGMVAYVVIKKE